jgi:hypothetical protein
MGYGCSRAGFERDEKIGALGDSETGQRPGRAG